MLCMASYPHRPKSGHITCYLNRTYHVLTTLAMLSLDEAFVRVYRSVPLGNSNKMDMGGCPPARG